MFMKPDQSEELQNKITEFSTNFSIFMVLGFKDMVIKQSIEEAEGAEKEELQLLEAPLPDWPLKSGFLSKRGENRKNWNKRWFVAKNAADGYVIEYYTDDKMKTLKGTIGAAGYHVEKDDKLKKFGLTLVPYDDGRRTWYIACDTAEEQTEWYSIFENACSYAEPAKDPDEMVQGAFEIAFEKLRRACGIWYHIRHDRSPPEMLAKLLALDLDRDLLPRILADATDPTGMLKSTARSMVRSFVAGMCFSACNTAWSSAKPAIDQIKTLFVEKVQSMVAPIVDIQVTMKGKIIDACGAITDPALSQISSTMLSPIVAQAVGPIGDAFKAGMRGFHAQAEKHISELTDAGSREQAVREMTSAVSYSYWSESPMVEAYQLLRDLRDSTLGEIANAIQGISVWSFIYEIDSGIRDLIRRAIFTLSKLIEEMGDAGAALNETMDRFAADSKTCLEKLVNSGLKAMIKQPIDENLISPCLEAVKTLTDSIPEPMKEIVNIDDMLEDTMNEIVLNGIKSCASGATSGAAGQIDSWRQ